VDRNKALDGGAANDGFANYRHQPYVVMRVRDTKTTSPKPMDSFNGAGVYDFVEQLVNKLSFDDWDLREGYVAGEITFDYSVFGNQRKEERYDGYDHLLIHLCENALPPKLDVRTENPDNVCFRLSDDVIGKVFNSPVQLGSIEVPSYAHYLIVSSGRPRHEGLYTAIELQDVHLNLNLVE